VKLKFWVSKDDLVIALLRLGKEHFDQGLDFNHAKSHLKGIGYKFADTRLTSLFFTDNMFNVADRENFGIGDAIDENKKWTLTEQGYFYLLEHDELASARNASRNATIFAGVAILISTAALVWSIFDADIVKIEPSQVSDFVEQTSLQK
jgi:hypothetical protein